MSRTSGISKDIVKIIATNLFGGVKALGVDYLKTTGEREMVVQTEKSLCEAGVNYVVSHDEKSNVNLLVSTMGIVSGGVVGADVGVALGTGVGFAVGGPIGATVGYVTGWCVGVVGGVRLGQCISHFNLYKRIKRCIQEEERIMWKW